MPKFAWPIVIRIDIKAIGERQAVTLGIWLLAIGLLLMAREDPKVWDVELFKIILQAVIISGIIGSIVAFHFAANKSDETKSANTAKAFDAITATAGVVGVPVSDVKDAAEQVAQAATHEAEIIAEDLKK
jgi:hypothetical protein